MRTQMALLIIDMQIDSFEVPGNPTYREAELLANISELLRKTHAAGTPVIYIQHQEQSGPLTVGTRGWQILPAIAPSEHDLVVPKYAEDAFWRQRWKRNCALAALRIWSCAAAAVTSAWIPPAVLQSVMASMSRW